MKTAKLIHAVILRDKEGHALFIGQYGLVAKVSDNLANRFADSQHARDMAKAYNIPEEKFFVDSIDLH